MGIFVVNEEKNYTFICQNAPAGTGIRSSFSKIYKELLNPFSGPSWGTKNALGGYNYTS